MSGFGADTLVPGQAGASDWAAGSLVLINLQGLPNDSGGMMSPTRNFGKLYGGGYQTRPVAAEEELASPLPLAYKREGGSVEQADSTAWMNDPYHPNWRNVSGHKAGGAEVTKGVETPHTQVTGGNKTAGAPRTNQPNSIHEQMRPDGSKSITYYDEKGRMFSREDYGQLRTHGQLGRGPDGRSVPHEHGVDWSNKGPIGKKYRELDSLGKPVGPWIKE